MVIGSEVSLPMRSTNVELVGSTSIVGTRCRENECQLLYACLHRCIRVYGEKKQTRTNVKDNERDGDERKRKNCINARYENLRVRRFVHLAGAFPPAIMEQSSRRSSVTSCRKQRRIPVILAEHHRQRYIRICPFENNTGWR